MLTRRMTAFALISLAAVLGPTAPAGAAAATAKATITVTAGKPSEFKFALSAARIPAGTVTFKVTNAGTIVHDFKIAGKKTRNLAPGQSQTLRVTFRKGARYPYLCTVSGHAAAGMKGVLTVRSGTPPPLRLKATLNARHAIPQPKAVRRTAIGHFNATLTGKTLRWRLTFAHLTGLATAAQIQIGAPAKTGAVLRLLCRRCSSPKNGTLKRLTAAQISLLRRGRTYVNVRTAKNPKGEIRGQIVSVGLAT
jgi:uncharacterized cupredoxin-like copper-binding protein